MKVAACTLGSPFISEANGSLQLSDSAQTASTTASGQRAAGGGPPHGSGGR